jgi:hypothetical protein
METSNNKLIDETVNSIHSIQRAETSPFLFNKIINRIKAGTPEQIYYTGAWFLRIAVSGVVIISLNAITIWSVTKQPQKQVNEQMELNKITQEYFGNDNVSSYFY